MDDERGYSDEEDVVYSCCCAGVLALPVLLLFIAVCLGLVRAIQYLW